VFVNKSILPLHNLSGESLPLTWSHSHKIMARCSCAVRLSYWYKISLLSSTIYKITNLVNKTNLLHNFFLVYLYLSISTCFGQLCAHHQEEQLCLCDTWYLLFCVDDYLLCRVVFSFHPVYETVPSVA